VSSASGELMTAESKLASASVTVAEKEDSAYQHWYFNPVSATCNNVAVRLDGGAGKGEVALTWEKPLGNIEQMEIYYDTDSNPEGRTLLATVDETSRSYTATGLENGVAYWFWVAYKSDGVSYNSNAFQSTPHDRYPVLSQIANPIKTELEDYKDDLLTGTLAEDKVIADNVISWQMPHGGFYKNKAAVYEQAWDGESTRSKWYNEVANEDGTTTKVELGTIDNDATVKELLFLADVYQRSGEIKYRDAARKALDFLLTMQYDKGGFPQVYPKRAVTEYSNYVTFNDSAMIRVMYLLDRIVEANWPLNGDVFTQEQRSDSKRVVKKGVKYIRRAQIFLDGERTIWSAQHDPENYAPLGGRSFELPARNGKASALIAAYMMSIPQTQDIKEVVDGALAFYRNPEVQEANKKYKKRAKNSTDDTYNPIQPAEGKTMWYRCYELTSNASFFSGNLPTDNPPGNGKQYDIMDIEPKRRYGYEWAGSYGSILLKYAKKVGYTTE
ncbi:MAG: pectate lyase, partial [Chromatiales bacterium]